MGDRKNLKMKKEISRIATLGNVNDENVNDVIYTILEINHLDTHKKSDQREPIKLIINSVGGDVYHGFGLIDCIVNSITPIHTICYGCAFSMALPIFAAGHHRQAGKLSTFMYHEISWNMEYEKIMTHDRELVEGKRIMQIYDDFLYTHTKLDVKKLKSVKKLNKDWYFNVEEALNYGIVDKII